MEATPAAPSGLLLIDKPAGISSFDIIRRLRRQTGIRKIGHAGTLDPAATGLMLMLVGTATKQAQALSGQDKRYTAQITLGVNSTTGDREGELTPVSSTKPTPEELTTALARLTGEISQTPSAYSAIKVGGVRAYRLARAGKAVEMPPRQVTVHELQLIDYRYPLVRVEASVSSGTYIRSLAEDLGRQLGTGAYLSELRRTHIGQFDVESAHALEAVDTKTIGEQLIPI